MSEKGSSLDNSFFKEAVKDNSEGLAKYGVDISEEEGLLKNTSPEENDHGKSFKTGTVKDGTWGA